MKFQKYYFCWEIDIIHLMMWFSAIPAMPNVWAAPGNDRISGGKGVDQLIGIQAAGKVDQVEPEFPESCNDET